MDQSYEEMCQEKARAAGSFSSGLAAQQTTARFDNCNDALEVKMPGIRERCENAHYRANRDARRASRMLELGILLDKNPEVARILDLMEEVGR